MNIVSYVKFEKLCNFINIFTELNHDFVKEGIYFPLLYSSRAIKWRKNTLTNCKHIWTKLIQELIMTSKLIRDIYM